MKTIKSKEGCTLISKDGLIYGKIIYLGNNYQESDFENIADDELDIQEDEKFEDIL